MNVQLIDTHTEKNVSIYYTTLNNWKVQKFNIIYEMGCDISEAVYRYYE